MLSFFTPISQHKTNVWESGFIVHVFGWKYLFCTWFSCPKNVRKMKAAYHVCLFSFLDFVAYYVWILWLIVCGFCGFSSYCVWILWIFLLIVCGWMGLPVTDWWCNREALLIDLTFCKRTMIIIINMMMMIILLVY